MKPSTKGYSPEQVASGSLDNGRPVVILYVKEFRKQIAQVKCAGQVNYFYTWSNKEDTDLHVLFVHWDNDQELAVVFPPNLHSVVETFKMPRDIIITSKPINVLVESARRSGQDFLDMEDSIMLRDVVLKESPGPNN